MADPKLDKPIDEQEVREEVLKEIKVLGDNTKAQYDEIRKTTESLKDSLEKGIEGNKEKVAKIVEDLSTRQEEVDKIHNDMVKRMDDLEVTLKRPGSPANQEVDQKAVEEMVGFWKSVGAAQGRILTADDEAKLIAEPKFDDLDAYKKAFPYFLRKDERLINPEQQKALSVGVDPDGGYTVTPAMSSRIISRIFERDPIRQLAGVETISTDALEMLADVNDVDAGWIGETATRSTTNTAQLGKRRIPVHIMYAAPKATQQLLEDSAINIESWLANKIADRFARLEGVAFVNGDGIGKPRGLLTYDNWTTAGTFEDGKIEQIAMGAAANLVADGFVKIKYSLTEDYLGRGTWLMNRTCVRDAMLLKDGEGNYLWKPSMIAADPTSTILGSPVRMSTTMPAVAANALAIAFADFGEAYLIVDRLGITVQRDPFTKKPFVEFYSRKRVGGQVVKFDAIKIGKISA